MPRLFLKFIFTIFMLLIGGSALCWELVHSSADSGEKADLFIIFKGDGFRVKKACQMMPASGAGYFAIPGVREKTLSNWADQYRLPPDLIPIPSDSLTRSTFEDALESDRIIRQRKFKSVILVTSDYHLLRSGVLLWLQTIGAGVKIHYLGIPEVRSNTQRAKLLYNEIVKFGGSLTEMAYHELTGRLMTDDEENNRRIKWVKERVLFNI